MQAHRGASKRESPLPYGAESRVNREAGPPTAKLPQGWEDVMHTAPSRCRPWPHTRPCPCLLLAWIVCGLLNGCAALTNPVANGVPVRRLPLELLGEPKEGLQSLPLTLLRQKPPELYRLGPDDLLGVWIEGVLGERGAAPPISFPESRALP